jgi:predicted MPP superfamily phosphohydrolase
MRRRTLDPPKLAVSDHPRPHFNPKSGWFRRVERRASLFLSREVWPRIPGGSMPYSAILERFLTVAEVEIPIAKLPSSFDGARVLFLSDIHAGPFLSRGALQRVFARLAALQPDVVIHGGDMATSNVHEIRRHEDAVARLTGPLGAFAVFGNHDHYTRDIEGVGRFFESCGVRVLNNDAIAVSRGGSHIALAGIDDWNSGLPDLDLAMVRSNQVAPGAPIVLISHNPDASLEAAARGVALTLSGHTHGGQVRIPGAPVLVRMSRFRLDEGRFEHDGAHIVVSRGLGVSGIPLRIACSPEALLVTLRKREGTVL